MLKDQLLYLLKSNFPLPPTNDQEQALDTFAEFVFSHNELSIMLLRGSAGTGKTLTASIIVKTMLQMHYNITLLAPTGRASKVLSTYANYPASTIHRFIYRERAFTGTDGEFNLNNNLYHDRFFLVDEASMINYTSYNSSFGSGSLLQDLIQYVYNGNNCRLILVGDNAQLPPVGEESSAALRSDILQSMNLQVFHTDIEEVLRQSLNSGILYNANSIRYMIDSGTQGTLPQIATKGFPDITIVPQDEIIDTIASSYSLQGIDETIIITRSNKRANIFNQGIRNMILDREEELSTCDMIMIVRNKYLSQEKKQQQNSSGRKLNFIANGDRAIVRRVRNYRELYGFRFADVTLRFPDFDDTELNTTVLLDVLNSEAPSLTSQQSKDLFNNIMEDYADIPQKAERMKLLKQDTYLNALQVKFGYAITCHKAQGGQWQHVFIDQGYITEQTLSPQYYHWLYTAFTRATKHLYLINWPKQQVKQT